MKENFKKKTGILMLICLLIPDIRLGMLLSNINILKIANQKTYTTNDSINLSLLTVLPIVSIIETLIFAILFITIKSEKIWKKLLVIIEVFLGISIFCFLLSIYNFA